MDLILRDKSFKKINVVKNPDYICNVGLLNSSSNDFILTQPLSDELIPIGNILTYGTTEFGGKILERLIDTQAQTVKYIGKTFRGVFDNFIAASGSFSINGGTDEELISIIIKLDETGLDRIYTVKGLGKTKPTNTFFEKGTTVHAAIDWFLRYFNEKMVITIDSNGVHIELKNIEKLSTTVFDSHVLIDENKLLPTAIHTSRLAGRAFLQGDGSYSQFDRFYTGLDAVEIWEEFPSDIENPTQQECFEWAKNRLQTIRRQQLTSEVFFDVEEADVGDEITAIAPQYGISTTKAIIEKTLKIQENSTDIFFKMGG